MQGCAIRPAWRSCTSRVAQSYGLRNRTQIAQATSRVAQSWKLRKRSCAILEFAQAKFRNPSLRNPEKLRNRTLFFDKTWKTVADLPSDAAMPPCVPSKAHQHIAHRPCCHTWLRAKRWPQQRGCHQAPRLPRKRNVDVAKCHTCTQSAVAARATNAGQARHQTQPSALSSTTPATQKRMDVPKVSRLPRKTTVDITDRVPCLPRATIKANQARHQTQHSATSARERGCHRAPPPPRKVPQVMCDKVMCERLCVTQSCV